MSGTELEIQFQPVFIIEPVFFTDVIFVKSKLIVLGNVLMVHR